MSTRIASILGAIVVPFFAVPALATVYWMPAHELAPQGYSCRMAAGDLDGDGDIDISLLSAAPISQFWNVGTPTDPAWQFDPSPFQSVPACTQQNGDLGDLDADGDLDLIVTCAYDEYISFYWNVGTPQSPVWEEDLLVFAGIQVSQGHACPRLADADADGDLDAFIGSWSGRIRYVRNAGTSPEPQFEYVGWIDGVSQADSPNPTFGLADLDSDGDLDIVRVSYDTEPECFENVGTLSSFEFVANDAMLAGVVIPPSGYGKGVELADIDGDGDPDMILARGYGENLLFLNGEATSVEKTSWGVIKSLYR